MSATAGMLREVRIDDLDSAVINAGALYALLKLTDEHAKELSLLNRSDCFN